MSLVVRQAVMVTVERGNQCRSEILASIKPATSLAEVLGGIDVVDVVGCVSRVRVASGFKAVSRRCEPVQFVRKP